MKKRGECECGEPVTVADQCGRCAEIDDGDCDVARDVTEILLTLGDVKGTPKCECGEPVYRTGRCIDCYGFWREGRMTRREVRRRLEEDARLRAQAAAIVAGHD